jgi:hypothetical protein
MGVLELPEIGIGALTPWCRPELVEAVIEKHHRREERRRLLPTATMVYFELARCLYSGQGYESVYEHLLDLGDVLDPGRAGTGYRVPNKSSLCRGRRRVGPDLMREVFEQVTGPLAEPAQCPVAFWRGRRLLAFDGTVLETADTEANAAAFGRPTGGGGTGGYPQARVVTLVECGTHGLLDAVIGSLHTGESQLATALAGACGPDTLVLADRAMPGVRLWQAFTETQADLLWRLKSNQATAIQQILPDGSYLSVMQASKDDTRHPGEPKPQPVTLRVLEYTMDDSTEVIRLGTTLLDPELYHQRWENEGILGEVKTIQRGPRTVLASTHPDGIRQQIWAHLTVHHLTRTLMYHSACGSTPAQDPRRISFQHAQRLITADLSPALSPL